MLPVFFWGKFAALIDLAGLYFPCYVSGPIAISSYRRRRRIGKTVEEAFFKSRRMTIAMQPLS
ncbi:hypothetical protein HNR39_002010 [Glaciimonas immobilis]|uniref:Uncharacterized protein n=1 Tax=Glaciimonas immobilis TaxID=728004 RepID=A0A840RQY1_9BURK|nr:hypothetical protein [Glaciimonas immobilis]